MKISKKFCPYFFIIVYLYSCFSTDYVSSQCLNHQKSLLLELRSSLKFNNSTKLVSWNESTDCCQWDGVECDNSNSRVIGLDLSYEAINSSIDDSSSLFHLHSLQRLNLAYNFGTLGTIPSTFSKLLDLTYLNLAFSGFSGQVPTEIAQLEKLIFLDLSANPLFETADSLHMESPNLVSIIGNLTNIKELYLDEVTISAEGDEWSKALSSSLPHLQVLNMGDCDLLGEIHQSLLKLQHLSVIRLYENHLSGALPRSIFQAPDRRESPLAPARFCKSKPPFL